MSADLTEQLKELYRVQRDIDRLMLRKSELKEEVQGLIIREQRVGKTFSVGNLNVAYKKKTTTESLSQKYLANQLESYFGDNEREAGRVLSFILDNRRKTENYSLDIIKKKETARS